MWSTQMLLWQSDSIQYIRCRNEISFAKLSTAEHN